MTTDADDLASERLAPAKASPEGFSQELERLLDDPKNYPMSQETVDAIISAHQDSVREIIGEDEPDTVVKELGKGSRIVQLNPRNLVRAEQRKRAGLDKT